MVAEQYDRWAETYAYMYGTPEKGVAQFANTIGRLVAATVPEGRVLDVGCGVGLSTAGLLEHGFDVVGIDVSVKSLEVAERYLSKYAGRFELIQGDARDLSQFAGAFDAVVAMSSLCDHVLDPADQESVVKGIAGSAKPGGHVYIDCYDHENIIPASPNDEVRYATIAELPDGPGIYFERRRYHGEPRSRLYDTDYYLVDAGNRVFQLSIPGRAVFISDYLKWLRQATMVDLAVLPPWDTGLHKHLCVARRLGQDEAAYHEMPAPSEDPDGERMVAGIRPADLPPNMFEEQPTTRRGPLRVRRAATGEKVFERRKQATLVMFSGGIDSTYSLVKVLRECDDDVIAHHVHFVNHENRHKAEAEACRRIVERLNETERPFMYMESTIDRRRFGVTGMDVIAAAFEVGVVSASFAKDRGHPIDRWTSGICLEEEIDDWGVEDVTETQHMLNAAAASSYPLQPPRFFQFPIIAKREQMHYMGEGVVDLCWTCRRPVAADDGSFLECGRCKTCLLMDDIRAGRRTVAEVD